VVDSAARRLRERFDGLGDGHLLEEPRLGAHLVTPVLAMRWSMERSRCSRTAAASRSYSASLVGTGFAPAGAATPFRSRSQATSDARTEAFSNRPWIIVPTTAPSAPIDPSPTPQGAPLRDVIS